MPGEVPVTTALLLALVLTHKPNCLAPNERQKYVFYCQCVDVQNIELQRCIQTKGKNCQSKHDAAVGKCKRDNHDN
jgi:hypothetical protein